MHCIQSRLLLLGADESDAKFVQEALDRHAPGEFAVIWVTRLEEALVQIQAEHCDAMLSGLDLPDSTGLATVRAIVAHAPELPLVMWGGPADEDLGREAVRYGAHNFLLKGDVGGGTIARALRSAIDSKRLEMGLRVAIEALEHSIAEQTAKLEFANKSLRESEARFRSLVQMSSDFYWETDAEHRFTRVDGAANSKISTVSPAPFGKRRWEMPYLSPDEPRWQAHRAALDAHLPFRDFQLSRLGPDGTEHYLSASGDPLFDAFGTFTGYHGVATDITERKQAEKMVRAAEEQFKGLVEQTMAGIYIIQDGKLAYVNPRYAQIFGYDSAEELIGRDALSLVAERDRAVHAERLRERLEGRKASESASFTGVRKDGTMTEVGIQGARATYRGRLAVIGLVQDISEKKRAEEQINRYVRQLETAFMRTVGVAAKLSEIRDPYTAGHERRVAEIAVAISVELGFDPHRQEGLRVAGYLHDIGKMAIPLEILTKPNKLAAAEFEMIKGHVQASFDVMREVEFPWPVAQVVLQHHERMDGSGYPVGLKDREIVLEARILAVADVIEAMSSHRPYRPGLGIDKALAEIERGRGSAYDTAVVDACLRLFREKGYHIPV